MTPLAAAALEDKFASTGIGDVDPGVDLGLLSYKRATLGDLLRGPLFYHALVHFVTFGGMLTHLGLQLTLS